MTTIYGRVVTPEGIIDGCVTFDNGKITYVGKKAESVGESYEFDDALILPGFIDVHMHGLGRYNVFEVEELVSIAKMQVRFRHDRFPAPALPSLSGPALFAVRP